MVEPNPNQPFVRHTGSTAVGEPQGGGNYSQYFPVAFSSLLLNVPSGNLSMSNIALSAGV
jgi:hypothetical protein